MSEQLIKSLTDEAAKYRHQKARLADKVKELEAALAETKGSLTKATKDLGTAATERDALKEAATKAPGEQAAELERLKGELKTRDAKDAWSKAVGAELADKADVADVWAKAGYTPGDKPPTPEQITELVGKAREAAPYLFKPADAKSEARPGTGDAAQRFQPGPGAGRGTPDTSTSRFVVRRSDFSDARWMHANQAKVASASADGSLVLVD